MRFFISLCLFIFGCNGYAQSSNYTKVYVDTIVKGEFSIRALHSDGDRVWYGANEGRVGFYDFTDNTHFERKILFDSLKPDFRSIASTPQHIFALNAGSPALLYKISKDVKSIKSVYRDRHPKIFYDSMLFADDLNGMAIGDPIDDCFSILLTNDGGSSWRQLACENIPKANVDEASFAASNSVLARKGKTYWFFTGGGSSRVVRSFDNGNSWEAFATPIASGKMTGIFSGDFYDENIGIIAGGNFDKPNDNSGNKAITSDGGKTWKLISDKQDFGYASCIKFVPGSNGNGIVSVGATGLWYSSDRGSTWKMLLEDPSLNVIEFKDGETAFAAGKNKLVRLRFR